MGMEVEQAEGLGRPGQWHSLGRLPAGEVGVGLGTLPRNSQWEQAGKTVSADTTACARTGFLSLHTGGTWDQIILSHGTVLGNCGMLNIVLDL